MRKSYKIRPSIFFLCLILTLFLWGNEAYATFSIVAVDTVTGAVGGAGASCINNCEIITDLIEGIGGVHTQASYLAGNQANAHALMLAGLTPDSIIGWLAANDVEGMPFYRQYGVVTLAGNGASAGYTGAGTTFWRGHITGPGYAIQGNILLDQQIVDTMEYAYLNTDGPLEEKLMAALEAANVPGADTRCMSCNKPAISAFIKVVHLGDGGTPYLYRLVTNTVCALNPVDSLRVLYDNWMALRYADADQSTVTVSSDHLGGNTDDSALITVTPLNHTGQPPTNGVNEVIITNLSYMGPISEVADNGDGTYSAWLHADDDYCSKDTIFVSISAGGQLTDVNQHPTIYMYECADANHNCAINILDATYLISYLYKGGNAPIPLESGDINGNGSINLLDISYLINYMYKGGPGPVCPPLIL
ncbi:MAG: hypothetical protein CVT49_14785 [candidate division Zixibacteria bacterium HGW-Zixibacteria-1]|nr:MAG: hypothetical protein CVT49_14785 [candidate division Zixibacteria bacterium HGW-Zixibacteria-1]